MVFIILFGRWPMLLLACHKPERRVLALFRLISKSTGVLFGPSLLYFSRVVYIFFPLKGETKKNIRKKEKGKWFFFFCGIFKSPALDSYFGLVSCFYLFLFSILHVDENNTRIVMCWDSSSNWSLPRRNSFDSQKKLPHIHMEIYFYFYFFAPHLLNSFLVAT